MAPRSDNCQLTTGTCSSRTLSAATEHTTTSPSHSTDTAPGLASASAQITLGCDTARAGDPIFPRRSSILGCPTLLACLWREGGHGSVTHVTAQTPEWRISSFYAARTQTLGLAHRVKIVPTLSPKAGDKGWAPMGKSDA